MTPQTDPHAGHSRRRYQSRCRTASAVVIDGLESRKLFDGLTGQYFNRVDQTELVTTRLDPQVNFTWLTSPATGVRADKFSVRWTGQVEAPTTENYTFYTTADDGVRLWVDGRLLIDNWVNQGTTERTATIAFEAGKRYDVRLDYYEFDTTARINLGWSSPTITRQTIPAARLFAAPFGLTATYFDNTNFSAPVLSRVDATVNALWLTGTPDPTTITPDGFAVRWSGYVVPEFSETYTFRVTAQAGASAARLRVDGQLLVDDASAQDGGRIKMEAGKRYALSLEYADPASAAGVSLQWQSPSRPLQVVPNDRLVAGVATSTPSRRTTYANPTLDIDAPDPGIIRADGAYWMLHTMGGPDVGWPLWKSLDGVTWMFQKHLLTTGNKRPWMTGDFWAPELHKVGNNFVLTGTSRDSRSGRLVIVMASSSAIDGTYTVRTEPIVSDSVSVLDSNVFQDDDGSLYLLWKRDHPSTFALHGTIRIRQLDGSGLNFASGSTDTVILDNETGGWENFLAEAPWLVKRDDFYYLFYSGSGFDTSYSLGVARGTTLTSMFARNPSNPIVKNNPTWIRPGHGGFATDGDGTLWHLYHAYRANNTAAGRKQVLDPVVWTASGWPSFTGSGVSTTPQVGPKVDALQGAGVLAFYGDVASTGQADAFRVVRSGTDSSMLDVYLNNVLLRSTPFAEVQQLTLDARDGNDTLVLDFTFGDVIPGNGFNFIGGTGTNDVVRVAAPANGITPFRYTAAGQMAFGSGLFRNAGVEKLIVAGGEHRFTADLAGVALDVSSGSRVVFDVDQRLGALSILPNARVTLASTNRTLVTGNLQLFAGATLDVADGTLIVDYAADTASPIADVAAALRRGRGLANDWTGAQGILSSTAASNHANGGTLGYAESASILPTLPATFGNTLVDATSLIVRYTIEGDTDLNQTVGFDDLLTLARNFGTSGKTFGEGNVDYSIDGSVNFDDLLVLAKRFGASVPLPTVAVTAASVATRARRPSAAASVLA